MPEIAVHSTSGTLFALVDEQDSEYLAQFRWNMAGGKGYLGRYAATAVVIDGRRTTRYMHRVVASRMGALDSDLPRSESGAWVKSVDHSNGDKLDNRRSNLRMRDRPQQMRNPNDSPRSTNRSGYRGVSFVKSRERFGKPWMAYVTVNYRTKNLGWYATVEEAAAARRTWDEQNQE